MKARRRWILLLARAAAVVLVLGTAVLLSRYLRALHPWSEGSEFSRKVADAVGEAVADGVARAIQRADRELAEVRAGEKRLTMQELARLRDLYAAGKLDQVRTELNSRFTDEELRELQRRIEALADGPSNGHSP